MARPEAPPKTPVAERLREARTIAGDLDRERFAASLGLNASAIARYERGDNPPDATALQAYRRVYRFSLDWIVSGEGDPILEAAQLPAAINNTVAVPQFDLFASAGPGAFSEDQDIKEVFYLGKEWLARFVPSGVRAGLIEARGDSMSPTIRDGDLMLVWLDVTESMVNDGGVFVVTISGMIVVKRLQRMRDGSIRIISDNAHYETETITQEEANAILQVNAKVVWKGSSLK